MNEYRKNDGFTLIEIVIAVVIVAILASIAIPGYQEQIRKARRADVMDLLTDCAAAQARNYSTASPPTYLNRAQMRANNLCNGSGATPNDLLSKEGFYQISQVRNPGCTVNGNRWCFILIATPAPGSPQVTDTVCQQWTIDHRDNKTANDNAGGTGNDTTALCWRS